MDQGSDEWLQERIGLVTMSRAKDLVANGRGNEPSQTRLTYLMTLAAERVSGVPADSYVSYDMQRGTFLEPFALESLSLATGIDWQRIGLVKTDCERIGASPDALSSDGGAEIKCPAPKKHVTNIIGDGMEEYMPQVQGCMWVCERDHWWLASYCPQVLGHPLHYVRVDRDEAIISKIRDSAMAAADEVDAMVAQVLSQSVPEPSRRQAANALDSWVSAQAVETEVII
jgi:hypothetical protein